MMTLVYIVEKEHTQGEEPSIIKAVCTSLETAQSLCEQPGMDSRYTPVALAWYMPGTSRWWSAKWTGTPYTFSITEHKLTGH